MRATNTTLTGFIPSDARRIRAQTGLKRGFDLIGGTALLVTLSPLLLVIALVVNSPAPAPPSSARPGSAPTANPSPC
jgi:lipopolysaccharide/colanic/teichoic acid biosynthesis glycosyltransferase